MTEIDLNLKNGLYICKIKDSHIEFDNVFNLNENLEKIFEKTGNKPPLIILDLDNLKTIDSSGIAFLMLLKNKIEDSKGLLSIINVSDFLKKTFSYIDINKYFNIFNDEEEATVFLKGKDLE